MTNPTETNLTAVEIARLSARVAGTSGYKRANSKEAAIKRLGNLVSEKFGEIAYGEYFEAILAAESFEAAINLVNKARDFSKPKADPKPEAAAKPKAPKADPKPRAKGGKRAEAEANAAAGIMPTPPDFSAATHKPYRARLAQVVAMAEAGDLEGLRAFEIKAYSSSPKAIARFRDLAVIALENRAKAPAKETKRLTEMTVDEYNASIIEAAVEYSATRKIGPGRYDTHKRASLDAARQKAAEMGVGTMIYAINQAGRQALVETIR